MYIGIQGYKWEWWETICELTGRLYVNYHEVYSVYFCEHEQGSNLSCEQRAPWKIQMVSSEYFVNFLYRIKISL